MVFLSKFSIGSRKLLAKARDGQSPLTSQKFRQRPCFLQRASFTLLPTLKCVRDLNDEDLREIVLCRNFKKFRHRLSKFLSKLEKRLFFRGHARSFAPTRSPSRTLGCALAHARLRNPCSRTFARPCARVPAFADTRIRTQRHSSLHRRAFARSAFAHPRIRAIMFAPPRARASTPSRIRAHVHSFLRIRWLRSRCYAGYAWCHLRRRCAVCSRLGSFVLSTRVHGMTDAC